MENIGRIEKLLALLLLQQMQTKPQREQAIALSHAGFTNAEIADLLNTSAAVISQALYEARKAPKKKKEKKKKKPGVRAKEKVKRRISTFHGAPI